jgi:HK97 family phage major capsid protein
MFAKKQREENNRLATEMRAYLDRIDNSGRNWTSAEREEYGKMETDYTVREELIAAQERSGARIDALARPIGGDGNGPQIADVEVQQYIKEFRTTPKALAEKRKAIMAEPHARAFYNYMRQGRHQEGLSGLSEQDREILSSLSSPNIQNAQSTVGSQGGYLIPQGFSQQLMEAMKWYGGTDGVVGEFDTATGNPWPWPTVNDTTNKGRIIGQDVQVTETDFVFGQVTFNAYIGSSDLVLIPLALMEDSYFDMDALTARLLGIRLGRLLNQQCTVGTGSASPTGIVNASVTAGNVVTLPTGETASVAYTDLVNLEHAVDPDYRYQPTTRWMFSDLMLKLLKKLVDGNNRPLWQPGLTASFAEGAAVDITASKPTILDHPYIINQDMATPAANAYTMLFGDMSAYKVRKVAGGLTLLRLVERYADYLQVGFVAFLRFDGQLIDAGTHPIAVMQQSAT